MFCIFLGICPFHLGYLISWHKIFHSIPLQFCKVGCNISFFTLDFSNLSLLSFLVSLTKGLSILLLFLMNHLLPLLIYSIFFFLFVSVLMFIPSFLFVLGFCSLFSCSYFLNVSVCVKFFNDNVLQICFSFVYLISSTSSF